MHTSNSNVNNTTSSVVTESAPVTKDARQLINEILQTEKPKPKSDYEAMVDPATIMHKARFILSSKGIEGEWSKWCISKKDAEKDAAEKALPLVKAAYGFI
jgi:hypothetical protein